MIFSSFIESITKKRSFPFFSHLEKIVRSASLTERIIFYVFSAALALSAGHLLATVHASSLVEVPRQGGSLREGVVGSPRFINPILAATDADRDLSVLVYAGLLKVAPDGSLIPELAQSYTSEDNGTSYIFTLRENITFHDGTPVTADDIVFTIEQIKNPTLKSPKWQNWTDVTIDKIDERQVKITPKTPYGPFLQNMTLGILPKHLWKNIPVDQFPFAPGNIEPIGAGPYRVTSVERGKTGVPTAYSFSPFQNYALGAPYIKTLTVRFYQNEELLMGAYNDGVIESMSSIAPQTAAALLAKTRIEHTPLLRVFGLFFNHNQASVLLNKEVRTALSLSVDREKIIADVLKSYGSPNARPVPPGLLPQDSTQTNATSTDARREEASLILKKAGWTFSTSTNTLEKKTKNSPTQSLSLSIATANAPELKAVADIIAANWSALGVSVAISVFEPGDLHQNVIRPRKYDVLLFGEIIGRDLDLYPFWHSSQRNDPGYNIAQYTNVTVDKLLEEARPLADNEERIKKYLLVEKEINKDIPAIFLYSPDFIYVIPEKINGFSIGNVSIPAERFASITEWYIETDHIWKPLADRRKR